MVFGTFDLLHEGHQYFLRKAKEFGDELRVVVARDTNVKRIKGTTPKQTENQRLEQLQQLPYVTHAVLGSQTDFYHVIETYKPDILCLGYDQQAYNIEKELHKRNLYPIIIRLEAFHPEQYKSSILRKQEK